MTHWKDRLLEADRELVREMSPGEVQRLRRTIVAEAASAARSGRRLSLPFVLTITALPGATAPPAGDVATAGEIAPETAQEGSGRQQLQFATPGGTRIIWVFDAKFEVKGTLP